MRHIVSTGGNIQKSGSISITPFVVWSGCWSSPRVTQYAGFVFLPQEIVFSEQLVVFALPNDTAFCVLQSRAHEAWARFFASSLEDRLRYTPSDCFETFPFPENFSETNERLDTVGKAYYDFRAQLMIANNEGLTKTYNRFHDPHERSSEIMKLRELHDAMDRAVLEAYGWRTSWPRASFCSTTKRTRTTKTARRAARSPGATVGQRPPRRSARPPPCPEPETGRTRTPGRTGSRSRHRHVPGTQEAV